MKKRLFIAIPLPDQLVDFFSEYKAQYQAHNVRWTKQENLHITVYFLGWINEKITLKLISNLKDTFLGIQPFELTFKEISFAPPGKPPRMIWAVFNDSRSYTDLALKISNAVRKFIKSDVMLKPIPHVTLARFKNGMALFNLKTVKPSEKSFQVSSCTLMESKLSPKGPTYSIIETFNFKN